MAQPPQEGPRATAPPGSAQPSRPALAQGRPSEVRVAGGGVFAIVWRGAALLVALGAIAGVVAHLAGASLPFLEEPPPELRDVRAIRGKGGALAFVGEVRNPAGSSIGAPKVTITLLDAAGAAVGSAGCEPPIRLLRAGEKVPCAFGFGPVTAYASMRVSTRARPPPEGIAPAALAVSGTTLGRSASGAKLDGTVKNGSAFVARRVVLLAGLLGADGKLVGQASIPVRDLEPGASATFSATVGDTASPPQSFTIQAYGYRE